jgi:hypothetical protein
MNPSQIPSHDPIYRLYSNSQSNAPTLDEQFRRNSNQTIIQSPNAQQIIHQHMQPPLFPVNTYQYPPQHPSISRNSIQHTPPLTTYYQNAPTRPLQTQVIPPSAPQQMVNPPVLDVKETTAPQGTLYPIRRRVQKRIICFDSRFRDNYIDTKSTDFIYNFPVPIKNVLSMRLNTIELPNSWYSYSEAKKSNTFQIIDASNVSRFITLPDGNYQAMDFEHETNMILDTEFGGNIFDISVNLIGCRTKISDRLGRNFELHFDTGDVNEDIRRNLGWYMGFRKASYTGNSVYLSEGIYNAGGNDYIYFMLNDFNHSETPSVMVMKDKTILEDNIIAKIPIANDKYQILFDSPSNGVLKQREYMGPTTISRIHVKILDEFGEVIDMNMMDFSFSLELEIAFE